MSVLGYSLPILGLSTCANLGRRSSPCNQNALHRGTRGFLWVVLSLAFVLLWGAPVRAKTAIQDYVDAMQPGWNLGNTLDATPNETDWGNPLTTQALIQQIKAQGFKSIRIPVSWDTHMGPGPTYTIDPAWMDRVEQIVNWSLDSGLYVMLNMHHDSYWIRTRPNNYLARYSAIWSQISLRFRDHSRNLMFESINEPEFDNVDDATELALMDELNRTFFALVRGTGGGNATRPLVMPTIATNAGQQFLDSLKSTILSLNDPNLIATTHYYGFWPFSVNNSGVTTVNSQVIDDITGSLTRCSDTMVAAGIPMVIGEIGLLNYNPYVEVVERGEMLKFFEIYTATAKAKGITWQMWDSGNQFNRYTHQWRDPELFGYFLGGVTGRSSTAASDLIFVKTGIPTDTTVSLNLNGNTFVSLYNGATPLVQGTDYLINGSVLTIKAGALAPYSSGAFGERAVFSANFSAGHAWKFHVRHQASSVLDANSGNKTDGLPIPVAFNGDLVETMEARYGEKGAPFPGPAEWTAFKEHSTAYLPDYANNSIKLTKAFFAATSNEPVNLTFHMWSGRKLSYRLSFQPGGSVVSDPTTLSLYEDALAVGWNDSSSWAPHNFNESTTVHSGAKAVSVDAGGYGGFVLTNGGPASDTSAYRTLVFWVHGGTVGGQNFGVRIERDGDSSSPGVSIPQPQANTWRKVEIPLSTLGVEGSPNITRVIFQNWTNATAPTLYFDDISLTTAYASDLVFVHGSPAPVISSPLLASAVQGTAFSYSVEAVNNPASFNVSGLPSWLSFDAASGVISGTPSSTGAYHFSLTATNQAGSTTEELTVQVIASPVVISFPGSTDPLNPRIEIPYDGSPHSLAPLTQPAGIPLTLTYDGGNIPPSLPGTYHVVARTQDASLDTVAEATLVITSSNPGRLINLSVRALAGTDSNILTIGFVTFGGTQDASLLIRGIGPTLAEHGLTNGLLADPRLNVFSGSAIIASNENWAPALNSLFTRTGAFALPESSTDAALAIDLPAGIYTSQVSGPLEGPVGATGIALGEIYDLNTSYSPDAPRLINASARCQVGSGDEVLVPGFVISGDTPLRVLIRAVGPTLSEYGVVGPLADPQMTLYRGTQAIGSNDDWDASLAATFAKVGAFVLPNGSKDAAIVVELPPGLYTAHVRSSDGSPGVALVEVYALPGL